MSIRLERLMLQLGKPGCYQVLVIGVITYQYVFFIGFMSGLSFWPITPDNVCENNGHIIEANSSHESALCWDPGNTTSNSIGRSLPNCSSKLESMHQSNNEEFYSVAMEFGLLCEKRYGIRLLQTLFFCGTMAGGIIFGPLADQYGRKPVLFSTVTMAATLGVIIVFVYNLYAFAVLKVLQGVFLQGYNSAANCIKPEILHGKYRPKYIAFADALSLSLPMFFLASVAYMTGNWRQLELITSLLLLVTVFTFCFIPETLRWLLKKKRKDEAVKVIEHLIKFNRLRSLSNISEELDAIIEEINVEDSEHYNYSFMDLFKISRMSLYSFIFGFNWFTWMFVSYGFQFSMGSLTGNFFVNFAILGFGDLIFRSMAYLLLLRWETRQVSCVGMSSCGILMLSMVIVRSVTDSHNTAVGIMCTVLGLLGRAFLGCFVVSTYILLSEVFPTPLRVTAYGFFMALGRVGALLAPQAIALGEYTWPEFPFFVFGMCGFVSGLLNLLLPSTRNQPMPNNMQDTLKLHSKVRRLSNAKV